MGCNEIKQTDVSGKSQINQVDNEKLFDLNNFQKNKLNEKQAKTDQERMSQIHA